MATATARAASPCDGVQRSLSAQRNAALAPAIVKQLHVKEVDVLQSFRLGGWEIVYVATPESDPPFLFYSADPLKNPYITLWSGAAAVYEERSIKDWTLKNAPGVPRKLASGMFCMARHQSTRSIDKCQMSPSERLHSSSTGI